MVKADHSIDEDIWHSRYQAMKGWAPMTHGKTGKPKTIGRVLRAMMG